MGEFSSAPPLNLCHVQTKACMLNRAHALLHSIPLLSLIHYRLSHLIFLLATYEPGTNKALPIILWLVIFSSELILSLMWFLAAAFGCRPVRRNVFPERLPESEKLPAIDLFICTTDPEKEPTLGVMNTVLSAMALDYPPEKLNVYVSDDGGYDVTLRGLREAMRFAKNWVPFCRSYGIRCGCPEAYFSEPDHKDDVYPSETFHEEKRKIKDEYDIFKANVLKIRDSNSGSFLNHGTSNRDHSSLIEVVEGDNRGNDTPRLVYVAREKKPSHPHHFKAGALNVLLRVSGIISNSPYILVLDCDMYCNDSSSAKQSMCFHLDPDMAQSLAYVQFPQRFHNISKNDIYDSQMRSTWEVLWPGMDGLQGPVLSGSGFYIKREALYRMPSLPQGITDVTQTFGTSNEFIQTLCQAYKHVSSGSLQQEAQHLASCTYEDQTEWGQEVGFMYESVVEDFFTGMKLHCKGWTSVYLDPPRPQFLGNGVTSLNDLLVQGTRWSSGLVDVALSKSSPLRYGWSKMSLLQTMCYSWVAPLPFHCIPSWCLATIPQLCLLNGVALYPQVSSSWHFMSFIFIFLSSNLKYLHEVMVTGRSIEAWVNETRIWMVKAVTCHLYGTLDGILKKLGAREASFMPTNKAQDDEQLRLYQTDKFNFQASDMLVGPLIFVATLSATAFIIGFAKTIYANNSWDKMFIQLLLSLFIISISWPVIEAMLIRKDKGSIGRNVALKWTGYSLGFSLLGSALLKLN